VTIGGNLKAKYVFHAVCPAWTGGEHQSDITAMETCVRNCFVKANEMKLTSLSFSPLSTGLYGFPKDKAVDIIIDQALRYVRENSGSTLRTVKFIAQENTMNKQFKDKLTEQSIETKEPARTTQDTLSDETNQSSQKNKRNPFNGEPNMPFGTPSDQSNQNIEVTEIIVIQKEVYVVPSQSSEPQAAVAGNDGYQERTSSNLDQDHHKHHGEDHIKSSASLEGHHHKHHQEEQKEAVASSQGTDQQVQEIVSKSVEQEIKEVIQEAIKVENTVEQIIENAPDIDDKHIGELIKEEEKMIQMENEILQKEQEIIKQEEEQLKKDEEFLDSLDAKPVEHHHHHEQKVEEVVVTETIIEEPTGVEEVIVTETIIEEPTKAEHHHHHHQHEQKVEEVIVTETVVESVMEGSNQVEVVETETIIENLKTGEIEVVDEIVVIENNQVIEEVVTNEEFKAEDFGSGNKESILSNEDTMDTKASSQSNLEEANEGKPENEVDEPEVGGKKKRNKKKKGGK